MPHMFLVIKGDARQAEDAARQRNVSLQSAKESDTWNSTYCTAPFEDRAKIIKWYCGAPSYGTTYPCAVGECLWYAERE